MSFHIIRQDIVKMQVDAIVNAANKFLLQGGGVCGAIFSAAGAVEMQKACDKLAPISTGQAVITPGFALSAKYVIHAVGPIYDAAKSELCRKQLSSAYAESLRLAEKNNCKSIAFPLISSGIYGYPKKEAMQVACSTILDFLAEHEMELYLTVFDNEALSLGESLLSEIKQHAEKK